MTTRFRPIRTIIRSTHHTQLIDLQNLRPLVCVFNMRILGLYKHLVASPLGTAILCKPPEVNIASPSFAMWNANKLEHWYLIISCCTSEICSLFIVPPKYSMYPYQCDCISGWRVGHHDVLLYKIMQFSEVLFHWLEKHNPKSLIESSIARIKR